MASRPLCQVRASIVCLLFCHHEGSGSWQAALAQHIDIGSVSGGIRSSISHSALHKREMSVSVHLDQVPQQAAHPLVVAAHDARLAFL
jgi:hypothetical protein